VLRNPSYCTEVDDAVYLVFHADRRSKTAGNLATFGRHDSNDIILPSVRTEKYNNHHFAFFLEPKSGELIIKDFSNRRTVIEVGHASPEDAVRYALHGTKPRQRVIPRMDREIYLTFGRLTKFCSVLGSQLDGADDEPATTEPATTESATTEYAKTTICFGTGSCSYRHDYDIGRLKAVGSYPQPTCKV